MKKVLITVALLLLPAIAMAQDPVQYPLTDFSKRVHASVGLSVEWQKPIRVADETVAPPQELAAFAGVSYSFTKSVSFVANASYGFESQRTRGLAGIRLKVL